MQTYQERILLVLLMLLAAGALAANLDHASDLSLARFEKDLKVRINPPAAPGESRLFVSSKFSDYYPAGRDEPFTLFGAPKKVAAAYRPPRLGLPRPYMPVPPAAATSPGPALQHSGKLPRTGAGPEEWKP